MNPGVEAAVQQVACRAGVVPVVFERMGDRLGHYRMSREVHDGPDVVLFQHGQYLFAVSHVSHDQGRIQHGLPEATGKIVEHYHALAASPQLQDHVAAYVARASGHQYHGLTHVCLMCARIPFRG